MFHHLIVPARRLALIMMLTATALASTALMASGAKADSFTRSRTTVPWSDCLITSGYVNSAYSHQYLAVTVRERDRDGSTGNGSQASAIDKRFFNTNYSKVKAASARFGG